MDPSALGVALGLVAYAALTVALIPLGRAFLAALPTGEEGTR